ncbi:MAG: 50S ribosomal protein L4 [Bacteroidales bacterium]|jgi:large subunit ribosomal protein L4|nr:50S ribosomal protein L4 [Bacteroidales bacterium]MCR5713687.1 50S ribosomal protein L4 [Bacteroidales bacterium]
MEVAVYNIEGKDTGRKVVLDDAIFGVEPNDHAIYLDVKQYLANQRQGTHKAKEKGENAHSTRKLKRQKGTGGARAGSLKSPLYPGGGRVFGPQPRDYSFKLNKKLKCLARRSALAYKAQENNIVVVEDFQFDAPKTKQFKQLCKNLNIQDKKSLFILSEQNENVYLSSRNLQRSSVVTICDLNTYGIMNAAVLVFGESAINALQTNE